MKGHFSYRI